MENGKPEIIWKGSSDYELARIGRVFNHRRPDRYPRGVLEATSVQDVVDAVKLAKDKGMRISVRSGGHSWAAVSGSQFPQRGEASLLSRNVVVC